MIHLWAIYNRAIYRISAQLCLRFGVFLYSSGQGRRAIQILRELLSTAQRLSPNISLDTLKHKKSKFTDRMNVTECIEFYHVRPGGPAQGPHRRHYLQSYCILFLIRRLHIPICVPSSSHRWERKGIACLDVYTTLTHLKSQIIPKWHGSVLILNTRFTYCLLLSSGEIYRDS